MTAQSNHPCLPGEPAMQSQLPSQRQRQRVLLVKEPRPGDDDKEGNRETHQRDPYEAVLTASGRFTVDFLAALSHRFTHLDDLAGIIRSGIPYSGVVFTSQRAVQAYGRAWKLANESSQRSARSSTLMRIPFYTVGPATAASLKRELPPSAIPPPELILGAADSGNAEKLAHFILAHRNSLTAEEQLTCAPLLYLVGDKRKDTLSKLLSAADVPVCELQVYETFPSPTFARDWDELTSRHLSTPSLAQRSSSPSTLPFDWIVIFSPSGAGLLLPLLPRDAWTWPRIAAIGPTTRDYLASSFMPSASSDGAEGTSIAVAAMAESPKPEALLDALIKAEATG